ncbi:MAG: nitroreductase [Gammaproteobacteria bacterium]
MSNHTQASESGLLEQVRELLVGRRTLSRFAHKKVDPQLIRDAIDVARWAPNHHLTEPWHFYVLGPEAIQTTIECVRARATEAKGEEMGRRKALRAENVPAWVIVTCKRSDDAIVQQEDYAATSCAIHNMALYLWQAGVGMKWCTGSMANSTYYSDALGLDSDNEFMAGILRIGYPLNTPIQKRKSTSEILTELD